MGVEKKHHVAWADRIGLPKIWFKDMEACSGAYGTKIYPLLVERFENDIINIKDDGPKLKDKIKAYKRDKLDKLASHYMAGWKETHPYERTNPAHIQDQRNELKMIKSRLLYNYIVQMLEDEGFGFYKGTYDGEMDNWD